jgi:serine/threonine protein kinase
LVRFYGAFFYEGTVKLVLEFMDLGSLDKVIEKVKNKPAPCTPEAILSKITQEVDNINIDSSRVVIFT